MKILSLSLLLLLAATVSHVQSSASVPGLIELLESNTIFGNEAELLEKEGLSINYPNCRSWHLGVETSNIINFDTVPANCKAYVEDYLITSKQYQYDSKTVNKEAYFYAKGLALKNDTVNVWIFDLDDTLLSSIPYYAKYGYGYIHINIVPIYITLTILSSYSFLKMFSCHIWKDTFHLTTLNS